MAIREAVRPAATGAIIFTMASCSLCRVTTSCTTALWRFVTGRDFGTA